MRSLLAAAFCLMVITLATSQDKNDAKPTIKAPVTLSPGEPKSAQAPRYSPPGRQLKLQPAAQTGLEGIDLLEARLPLGPDKKTEGLQLIVARAEKGKPYTRLYIQEQPGGKLSEKAIVIKPSVIRNKTWSSFEAMVQVKHAESDLQPYPIALWIVVDNEGDTPDIIRISRRGYLHGEVKLGESMFDVILSDSNNDGVLGTGDWWELRDRVKPGAAMRTVGDFAWAGGKAWQIELTGTNGRSAQLVSYDPRMTEEEDTIRRDSLRADRLAPRAVKPVNFRKDVDETLKEVATKKAVCFIKFETDWCMPCKQMTELVFTARDVADASDGITCLIVDGDARKDLTEKHKVKAYPTGILFDANGEEIARYVGYQSVKQTTAFLQKAKK